MAQLVQERKLTAPPLAAVALAASLIGGIVGGTAVMANTTFVDSAAAGAGTVATGIDDAKWLTYGQEWEARYRQMYPNSR